MPYTLEIPPRKFVSEFASTLSHLRHSLKRAFTRRFLVFIHCYMFLSLAAAAAVAASSNFL